MKEKRKWFALDERALSNLLVVLIGILFYQGLSHVAVVRQALSVVVGVLSPFIMGFTIAYLLNTPMMFFERKLYHKLKAKRTLAIITVYLLAVAVLAVLLNLVLPQVWQSIMGLVGNIDTYSKNLSAWVQVLTEKYSLDWAGIQTLFLSYQDIMKQAANIVGTALPGLLNLGVAVGGGLISAITALISSVYLLAGKGRLIPQTKRVLYAFVPGDKADRFLSIGREANRVFVGFINGKIIDSAIIGVLCFILTSIFQIQLAVLVSLVVGVTNVIPFFGPIIGGVPCVMILLIVDPLSALKFAILVIVLQQFDGNILGPKILGDSTGLSAIWVLVAIVVGGGLFGFPGMILGVPTFAVLYSLVRVWVNNRLTHKGVDGNGRPCAPVATVVSPPDEPDDA